MINEEMEIGAKLAAEMNKMLLNELNGKSKKYAFMVGNYCLSSLITGFIDEIFSNEFPDKKRQFVSELISLSQRLLLAKDKIRDANTNEKH
jgi:hypothetical protein